MASVDNHAKERTIGSVVSHPLRSLCLARLADRTASPAELAHEFHKPLSDVSYHIATLLKAGAIELVGERPVRGSVEHFYRAIRQPYVSNEENAALPLEQRIAFARQSFQLAAADATIAFEAETFNQRPDAYAMRMPMVVDEEGWSELVELYAEMADRIFEVRTKSDGRRAESGDADDSAIPTTAFVTFFERPPR